MQKRELLGRQIYTLRATKGTVAPLIELQIGYFEYLRYRNVFTSTHKGSYSGKQLWELKRFNQIVISTQIEPANFVRKPSPGRQHHHPGIAALAQMFKNTPAIKFWKINVEYHQIIDMLTCKMKSICSGYRTVDYIATFCQPLMQVFGSFRLVLNYKDSHDISPSSIGSQLGQKCYCFIF
ncbi:hypothetical protein PMO01_27540 [Pseudomonas moraviensis R28-S]|uniref:Uncharacterized protein n=1 Tax=Pseudomonas moraviensis R28-S TaxID=1395516 RepID=V8R202_9PSED|nr:hypothetical protein PMO01_27540 [Pseudomonas moraviensis R28-S]